MTPFFRRIRRQLADDNEFLKYSRYAIGEIVLVVIGILLALQINNWNEIKKENERFKLILEQVFNDINVKKDWLKNYQLSLERQVSLIDSLLINPDNIPDNILPFALFYVDMGINRNPIDHQGSEILRILSYNHDDLNQLKVSKQIISSIQNFAWVIENKEQILEPLLNEAGIPSPSLTYSFSQFNNFQSVDKNFFRQEEIDRIRILIPTLDFQTALRTLKASRLKAMDLELANTLQDINSLSKIIKSYHPEVRLLFKDIGIVGSALETGWDQTIYMSQTDPDKSIWTIKLRLNNGRLKFRSSNSWSQNWGGTSFPTGDAVYYWEDIPIQGGYYKVTLNLENKTYKFEPIETQTP